MHIHVCACIHVCMGKKENWNNYQKRDCLKEFGGGEVNKVNKNINSGRTHIYKLKCV